MASKAFTLFQEIEDLSKTRDHEELAAMLQPILKRLAYYAVMSEGAALEDREDWHDNFTGGLYDDRGEGLPAEVAEARAARSAAESSGAPKSRLTPAAQASQRGSGGGHGGKQSKHHKGPAPNPTRQAAEAISPALLAIMGGTHPSLREGANY